MSTSLEDTGLTVWRHPKRGKGHREKDGTGRTACSDLTMRGYEQVPLSQVAPEDLCRSCWRGASRRAVS
jgi:hypothetical protein